MSHRNLMPKLLLAASHKGWPNFQRLLLALLRFLEPYLRNAELTDAVRLLYKVCQHCCPDIRHMITEKKRLRLSASINEETHDHTCVVVRSSLH